MNSKEIEVAGPIIVRGFGRQINIVSWKVSRNTLLKNQFYELKSENFIVKYYSAKSFLTEF